MEVEANSFAPLLLMALPLLRFRLRDARHLSLEQLVELAETFDVSKDVMARAYTAHHDEPIAVLIWRAGRLVRCYRSQAMPWLGVRAWDRAAYGQLGSFADGRAGSISAPSDVQHHHWFYDRSARLVLN